MLQLKIWREKSTTALSLLSTIKNKAVDHHQVHQLLASSRYWQGCRRTEFFAQQQKNLKRSIFQQRITSDVGQLVYKHKRRYYYISTYVTMSVMMAFGVINSALLLSGYLPPTPEYDEPTTYMALSVVLTFGILLYLTTHALMSRTVFYMYYSESTHRFLGICYNWRMARKNLVFKPGEVQLVGDNAGMMQRLFAGYIINKKSYHISTPGFSSTRYYNLMLGFIDH